MKNIPNEPETSVAVLCLDGDVGMYADALSFIEWKLHSIDSFITRIGCSGALKTCTSINARGKVDISDVEREKICCRCKQSQRGIQADAVFDVNSESEEALNRDDNAFIDEVRTCLEHTGRIFDTLSLTFQKIPLCQIAFFDFAIITKLRPDSVLNARMKQRFVDGVIDLIRLLHLFDRSVSNHKFTHMVYVNGNYSHNTLARYFFKRLNTICLSIEPQLTSQYILNRVMLVPDRLVLDPEGLLNSGLSNMSTNPRTASNLTNCLNNFGARINGAEFNAYTSLDSQAVPLEELKKVSLFFSSYERIHSFMLSSEDELTPHIVVHSQARDSRSNFLDSFDGQMEFTEYLLNEAKNHSGIGFIIRLHPRMAINKRNDFESEEHLRYKDLVNKMDIPPNVLVIFGDSKISSYFIVSLSDLVIVSWSTIGLESLLLGTPVVSIFPKYLMYPIYSFSKQPKTRRELKEALFKTSGYGVPLDEKLTSWVSMAFEGQFFVTAAPRGKNNILGKMYSLIHKGTKKTGIYNWLAAVVNRVFLRQLKLDPECLFRNGADEKASNSKKVGENVWIIEVYRQKYGKLLDDYWQQINNLKR